MAVTHKPKSGSLLTGTEYEAADSHNVSLSAADVGAEAAGAVATHAATLHDAAIPTYIQATDPALAPPAKYLWVDTNTDFLWYNDGQIS